MNVYRHTFLLLACLLIYSTSLSAIHRVNNDPSSTAGFQDLQSAINIAVDGDTIYVEANSQLFGLPIFAEYSATIDKPVVIIGPGYLIPDNNPGYNVVDEALCSFISLVQGAEGCILRGLNIEQLQVSSNQAQVRYNFIGNCVLNGAMNFNIEGNLISSPNSAIAALEFNNSGNGNVVNNIIEHQASQNPGQYVIFSNASSGIDFNHNLLANGFSVAEASLFHNCLFLDHTFEDFDFCNFNNDIFVAGPDVATDFDLDGNANDDTQILLGLDVFTDIAPSALFALLSSSTDGQYELFPGSFADGQADDGADVGPFSTGYVFSGQVDFPVVTNLFISNTSDFSYLLPATYAAQVNSLIDVIIGGEYFLDFDPGFGSGIPVNTNTGNNIEGFFAANIATAAVGGHIIGFRVITQSGLWSQTEETFFQVDAVPVIPSLASISYVISDLAVDADFEAATILENQGGGIDEGFFTIVYDLSELPPGLHYLSIRAKDEFGLEGTTYITPMLVLEDQQPIPTLTAFEYFIDQDPGYGEGTTILISGTEDLFEGDLQFMLTGVSQGQHVIYLRAKDSNGAYGTTQQQYIYVVDDQFGIADQNNDCVIDILDILSFLGDYGCVSDGVINCGADVNLDGVTDILDILIFLSLFGSECQDSSGLVSTQETSSLTK
ncbi:MAG: hypothetical protein ACI84C_001533 [Flavobacteriales bacterium]|jgi:hypothetical protein